MLKNDKNLPALPILEKGKLCQSLLPLLAPIVDAEAFLKAQKNCTAFMNSSAWQKLHDALEQWAMSLPAGKSWLRYFWDDAYLEFRGALPLNMNYALAANPCVWGEKNTTANIIRALALLAKVAWQGELSAEKMREQPLAMEQVRFLWGTRIAQPAKDTMTFCQPCGLLYAVTFCKGYTFVLPLTSPDGVVRSSVAIEKDLQRIREKTTSRGTFAGVGLLSSMPREKAASLRVQMLQKELNRLSFAILEQALFAVCLDGNESTLGFEHRLLAREPENRYFDKTLQIIAKPNGKVGFNLEHASCDASIWIYVLQQAVKLLEGGKEKDSEDGLNHKQIMELNWNIEGVVTELSTHKKSFCMQADNLELVCLELPDYGRKALKNIGCSPDAFIQSAFQTAQLSVFGKFFSAYEAVSMRHFSEGRTECARPSSIQAKELAEAILGNAPKEELAKLFRLAEQEHRLRLAQCQQGKGVERYLYGLEKMYKLFGEQLGVPSLPKFFNDTALRSLQENRLSTSGLASNCIRHFCFAPVHQEGFGLGYNATESHLYVSISHFKGNIKASDFAHAFLEALSVLSHALG